MDLICSLWGSFGSSSLATLPLGFRCGFIFPSACRLSTEVCSWSCPGGLGFAPVRASCGGGAAVWVTGVLAAAGTQGSWRPGQQEIQCSRRVRQPVVAHTLQYSCLKNHPPFSVREAWQATVYRLVKNRTLLKQPCEHRRETLLARGSVPQWELSVKLAQLLSLRGPWQRHVCRRTDCLHHRHHGPIRGFFQASCN